MPRSIPLIGIFLSFVMACGKRDSRKAGAPPLPLPTVPSSYEELRPALPDQPYTVKDRACFNLSGSRSCSPEQFTNLSDAASVTVEKILRRSFVHQPWAGMRLQQVLSHWPVDLLPLASCSQSLMMGNSIVVAHQKIGSIFLDPKYFAVTDEEKATLSSVKDPRAARTNQAPFQEYSIYTKLPQYILSDSKLTPAEKVMIIRASHVLVHEMVHACDVNKTPDLAVNPMSKRLETLPLNILGKLVNVFSKGNTEFAAEVKNTPLDLYLEALATDDSVLLYDYENHQEHFADLAEVMLFKVFFGVGNRSLVTVAKQENDQTIREVQATLSHQVCLPQVWRKAKAVVDMLGLFKKDLIPDSPDCDYAEQRESIQMDEYMKSKRFELIP